MTMNEFLAEMFGTRENIGAPAADASDVEKLAEAQLLDEALAAEGIDIDALSAEQIVKVAGAMFGEDSKLVKSAAQPAEVAQPAVQPAKTAAAQPAKTDDQKIKEAALAELKTKV